MFARSRLLGVLFVRGQTSGARRGRRHGSRAAISATAVLLVALMTSCAPHPEGGGERRTLHEAAVLVPAGEGQGARRPTVGPRRGITCPAGSVLLRRARSIQEVINSRRARTTFCFASKTYRLNGPIRPRSHNTFIGEFGATLDGSRWQTNESSQGAFSGVNRDVDDVTIRNLVIRDMPQKGIAGGSGAPDHWTINHNEISGAQAGISIPDYSRVTNNFIHHNDQYGFGGFKGTGFVFRNNEVSYNDTCNCYPGDGGASKLVATTNVSVIGNYIHDNGGNAIWFDTDNTGVLIEGNTVSVNMKYGKAISLEQNDGTAIIRNNTIRVRSGGEVAIRVNNSSNVQITNNRVTMASTSGGGAIHIFFDASRTGYDTRNNSVTNNTITLRGSATITAGVTCARVTDCAPYWTTKGNLFQGNTYRVPNRSGRNWALVSAVSWPSWQAVGFDTTGDIISP